MTVISPYCPPSTSWTFLANSASGLSGLASYCKRLVCWNMTIFFLFFLV